MIDPENWRPAYMGLYADGAAIKTEFDLSSSDIALTLSRNHDTPDEVYVVTAAQANEIIYAISKALMDKWSVEHNAEPPDDE